MHSPENQALLAIEYERIGQLDGEAWSSRYPFRDDIRATDYLALLRRVASGTGLRGYLELVAMDRAAHLITPR